MKTLTKLSMYLAAGLMLLAAGCNLPDPDGPDTTGGIDPNNYFSYGVKSGYIAYKSTNVDSYYDETTVDTFIMAFDEYGKKFRMEVSEDGTEAVVIIDGITGKMYTLNVEEKSYVELSVTPGTEMGYGAAFVYLGDDATSLWAYYPGFSKKPNKTIAGKNCSVVSWSDGEESVEWGGWNRITFWMQTSSSDDSSTLEAISFSESLPNGSFSPPADYTKLNYGQ